MTLGVALAVIFTLGWVPLYLCRAETLWDALPGYTGAERLWVQLTPLVLAAHMTAACITLSYASAIALWAAAVGVLTFAGAVAFWFWGRVLIGPLRVTRLPDEPPLQFRRDGAFGIVRHPLYFAYLVACAAPLLVVPRRFLFATFGVCLLVVAVRAVQEERRLRSHLGAAYDAYSGGVKRLVPFVW